MGKTMIQQGSNDDGIHIKANAKKTSEGGSSPFIMVNNFIKSTHPDTPCSEEELCHSYRSTQ